MNIEVIAEGLETERQFEQVRALQCDYVQGCLFSKPVGSGQARAFLKGGMNPERPAEGATARQNLISKAEGL